jgi:hypothetical protein
MTFLVGCCSLSIHARCALLNQTYVCEGDRQVTEVLSELALCSVRIVPSSWVIAVGLLGDLK